MINSLPPTLGWMMFKLHPGIKIIYLCIIWFATLNFINHQPYLDLAAALFIRPWAACSFLSSSLALPN